MSKQIEALKLALEALEQWNTPLYKRKTAITAIREALAEQQSGIKQVIELYDSPEQPAQQWNAGVPPLYPEPEPGVSFKVADEQPAPPPPECQTEAEKTAFAFGWWKALEMHRTPAQQQEPVAWYCKEGLNRGVSLKQECPDWEPLYTTKFNFKPLTAEEADELVRRFARYELLRAIEAKLKEKNA